MSDLNHARTITAATAAIMSAYVSRNQVPVSDTPVLMQTIRQTLEGLGQPAAPAASARPTPAVPINKSITNDYLICLDDGAKFKSLRRHLSQLGMTPEEYRAKWGLPHDYPMVAPSYAARRSEIALATGLGRKERGAVEAVIEQDAPSVETVEQAVEAVETIVEAGAASPAAAELVETFVEATSVETGDDVVGDEVTTTIDQDQPLNVAAIDEAFDDDDHTHGDEPVNEADFIAAGGGALPDGYASVQDTFTDVDGKPALVCLIDGKACKDLGRHARKHHGVSAEAYRARFGLPSDYPMTADRVEAFRAKAV